MVIDRHDVLNSLQAPFRLTGTPELRRVRPSDAEALRRFYSGLSAESRRARFLGACDGLTENQASSFCAPDHRHAEGFVAEVTDAAGAARIVGHLCLEPSRGRALELAVAVADDWQSRGIGRALFETALAWSMARGYEEIVATAYVDNSRVLRLLSSAPQPARIRGPDAGVVTVTIPLVETANPKTRRRVAWQRRPLPERAAAG